jgi:hypothetical protein
MRNLAGREMTNESRLRVFELHLRKADNTCELLLFAPLSPIPQSSELVAWLFHAIRPYFYPIGFCKYRTKFSDRDLL